MTVLVSHPTGNANVRAVLRASTAPMRLDTFWTSVAVPLSLCKMPLITEGMSRQLARRCFAEVPWRRIKTRSPLELARLGARAMSVSPLIRHEVGWASVDAIYRDLDARVAAHLAGRDNADLRAVYAYEDGACATFRAAGARGVRRIYDLPIAHWRTLRRLLAEEAELQPEWAPTMEGLRDSADKLARKDEEIALADRIVVASSFTRRSLEEHFGDALPITVTPYGAPPPIVDAPAARADDEPLHLLYAGHLSQRKGLAYLLAALPRLEGPWRLTLAGPMPSHVPPTLARWLEDPRCTWLGAIPHPTLLEAMARAHVFVFPSLVEGFGLVLNEAMAAGLPVVTTAHTAGPDLLREGVDGFVVPIRDPDAIAARLSALAADEPRRRAMGEAALAAASAAGWGTYEDRIRAVLAAELA